MDWYHTLKQAQNTNYFHRRAGLFNGKWIKKYHTASNDDRHCNGIFSIIGQNGNNTIFFRLGTSLAHFTTTNQDTTDNKLQI